MSKKKNKRAPQSAKPGEGRKFYSFDKVIKESQEQKQKEFIGILRMMGLVAFK